MTRPVFDTAWPWDSAEFKPADDAKDLRRAGAPMAAALACQIRLREVAIDDILSTPNDEIDTAECNQN